MLYQLKRMNKRFLVAGVFCVVFCEGRFQSKFRCFNSIGALVDRWFDHLRESFRPSVATG
ncbi:MAG: hypothetical protein ACI8ZW_000467 [Yoonia sp.]|jgi:hypothetical protein